MDEFVAAAVWDRLRTVTEIHRSRPEVSAEQLKAIQEQFAALPVLDRRSPEEMLGYDERGLPAR